MLKDHNSAFRAGGIWLCWESPLILWSVSIHISGFLLAEKGGGAHTTVGCYLLVCHFLQLFSASDIDFQCHFDLISPVSEQSLTVDASQHPEISISPDFGKIHRKPSHAVTEEFLLMIAARNYFPPWLGLFLEDKNLSWFWILQRKHLPPAKY